MSIAWNYIWIHTQHINDLLSSLIEKGERKMADTQCEIYIKIDFFQCTEVLFIQIFVYKQRAKTEELCVTT